MASQCVVRFFERNDRIKKHLLKRIVVNNDSIEYALAVAYNSLKQTSEETKATLLSVEVEVVESSVIVEAA